MEKVVKREIEFCGGFSGYGFRRKENKLPRCSHLSSGYFVEARARSRTAQPKLILSRERTADQRNRVIVSPTSSFVILRGIYANHLKLVLKHLLPGHCSGCITVCGLRHRVKVDPVDGEHGASGYH